MSSLPPRTATRSFATMERDAQVRAGAYSVLAAAVKQLPPPVSDAEEVDEWIGSIEYLARFHQIAAQAADSGDREDHSAAVRSIEGEIDVARWKGSVLAVDCP
jgi:hypothetical protein